MTAFQTTGAMPVRSFDTDSEISFRHLCWFEEHAENSTDVAEKRLQKILDVPICASSYTGNAKNNPGRSFPFSVVTPSGIRHFTAFMFTAFDINNDLRTKKLIEWSDVVVSEKCSRPENARYEFFKQRNEIDIDPSLLCILFNNIQPLFIL